MRIMRNLKNSNQSIRLCLKIHCRPRMLKKQADSKKQK